MPARRLAAPLHPGAPRGGLVRFRVDGREIEAPAGEPLAVALLAAGRPILSRSFRFHRPRGLMCSTGQCGWCECEVDGRPSVRSCRVPVREGLMARGEHALPSVDRDVLELVGLGARWIPPTFYHHRFLRPYRLRKRYLDVLRWFGGRGRLRTDEAAGAGPNGAGPAGRRLRQLETDVLVVGGGPAGIHAALGAADAGARVVLLEAEPSAGSTWRWRAELDARLAAALEGLDHAGVEVRTATPAAGVYGRVVTAVGPDEQLEITPAAVVAATGTYERLPTIPNNDRPGVLGARTVEWLVRAHGVLPGERAVVAGSADDVAGAVEALEAGGATVVARVATDELVRVDGARGVTGVRLRDGRRVAADVLVIGDRTPALDLPLAAGAAIRPAGGAIVVEHAAGRTSVPWLLVAGGVATGPATAADPDRAQQAGLAAARAALARDPRADPDGPRRAGAAAPPTATGVGRATARALVCFCEDVHAGELHAELDAGIVEPEMLKRRTGALTGPCQGKYCLAGFVSCLARTGAGAATAGGPGNGSMVTTARPPLRPIRLGDFAAVEEPVER